MEEIISRHKDVIDWQSNPDVQKRMRRDIKRLLRPSGNYSEQDLDKLANQIVELSRRRVER